VSVLRGLEWKYLDVLDDQRGIPLLERDNRRDGALGSQLRVISCCVKVLCKGTAGRSADSMMSRKRRLLVPEPLIRVSVAENPWSVL
jgi:hypothetical protein